MTHGTSCGPSPVARPGCSRFRAVLLSAVLLAGCQTTLSLEEAKEVTATFEGKGFIPPPRTIKDITAILDEQAIADPEESARQVAKADEIPPATRDAKTLASFYYARGKAADAVGRQQQYVEDLRTAVQFAEKTASVNPMLWSDLAWAESSVGNYKAAIRLMELRARAQPESYGASGGLARLLSRSGDMEAAEAEKKRTLQLIANNRGTSPWRAINKGMVESELLGRQGRPAEAEPFIRQAINAFENAGLARDYPNSSIIGVASWRATCASRGALWKRRSSPATRC